MAMLRLVMITVLLAAHAQALVVRAPVVRPHAPSHARAAPARMGIAVFGATGGTGGEAVRCSADAYTRRA